MCEKLTDQFTKFIKTKGKEFEADYVVLGSKFDAFYNLCKVADNLLEEFDITSAKLCFDAGENDINAHILITTDELIFEYGDSHEFLRNIDTADFISFSNANGELCVEIGVKGVWIA